MDTFSWIYIGTVLYFCIIVVYVLFFVFISIYIAYKAED